LLLIEGTYAVPGLLEPWDAQLSVCTEGRRLRFATANRSTGLGSQFRAALKNPDRPLSV
jgi:hypothetical protein